jgi:hypothetical protein
MKNFLRKLIRFLFPVYEGEEKNLSDGEKAQIRLDVMDPTKIAH